MAQQQDTTEIDEAQEAEDFHDMLFFTENEIPVYRAGELVMVVNMADDYGLEARL